MSEPDLSLREAVALRLGWRLIASTTPGQRWRFAATEAVLDWLTANGWDIRMVRQQHRNIWRVEVWIDNKRDGHFFADGESLPLAICRAFVQLPLPTG